MFGPALHKNSIKYVLGSITQGLSVPLKFDFSCPKVVGLFLHLRPEETLLSLFNGLA